MKKLSLILSLSFLLGTSVHVEAQSRHSPLKTDPAVGNIQSIEGYGRSLKTDPDQGAGFSYHVHSTPAVAAVQTLATGGQTSQPQSNSTGADGDNNTQGQPQLFSQQSLATYNSQPFATPFVHGSRSYFDQPFDATAGLRNYSTSQGIPGGLNPYSRFNPYSEGFFSTQAVGVVNDNVEGQSTIQLYHQPLIHIKMRVVEVLRNDDLRASSVLEYVSRANGEASLTTGTPLNGANQNVRSKTNFPVAGLIDGTMAGTGSGLVLNMTGEHINSVVSLLATDFNADIVTAPSVVTLNGQNVEFVSGQKVPFRLGQNATVGGMSTVQEFFYKNVGAYVSVTPKIVNWGLHGEGAGDAVVAATDVSNWNMLVDWLYDTDGLLGNSDADKELKGTLEHYYDNQLPIPFSVKSAVLMHLSEYNRTELIQLGVVHELEEFVDVQRCCRGWKPGNCTIDVALVVRLSEKGDQNITLDNAADAPLTTSFENNVRAIANIIQLQSGEGLVMAGLIGEREVQSANKIPVLGDLPFLGAAFRSKATLREKTEVLIFIEAEVLDRDPAVARAQSAQDYRLSQPFLNDSLLDNPLECGFCRTGFGQYLPPACPREQAYWKHFNRSMRRLSTNTADLFR